MAGTEERAGFLQLLGDRETIKAELSALQNPQHRRTSKKQIHRFAQDDKFRTDYVARNSHAVDKDHDYSLGRNYS